MTSYLSGAEALADARLRLAGLPPDQGVLIVEGRDDVRVFAPYCIATTSLVPCGSKAKLLEAHELLLPGEHRNIAFVADCDYDVPTGRMKPGGNLIVTEGVDVEADLIRLGLIQRLVAELVPSAISSDEQCAAITTMVIERATVLAEAIGRFRMLSATEGLGLRFTGLKHRRYRTAHRATADVEKLSTTLYNTAAVCHLSAEKLAKAAAGLSGGPSICHGKDMLSAVAVVLHDDFGVPQPQLKELATLLRLALTREAFAHWQVAQRLASWQAKSGRRVINLRS